MKDKRNHYPFYEIGMNNKHTISSSTNTNDEVITPAGNGDFSTTATIENGQNQITIIAVAPNGEEKKIVKTLTFSTEEF